MKYSSYSIEQKLKAVETAEKTTKRNAARKHGVDVKRIREWCKQKSQLMASRKKSKRLPGGGRSPASEEIEKELIEWIRSLREKRLRVSRKMIQEKARELHKSCRPNDDDSNFSASDGWLFRFMRRHSFSLRKRTTISQKLPADIKQKVVDFLIYVEGLRKNCGYKLHQIAAFDETAVWVDAIQHRTIEETGAKQVAIFSSGNHKAKFTVSLAATADGGKLKPFITFKGKKMPSDLAGFQDAVISVTENGWMTESSTLRWLHEVWGLFSFGRRLLAWDSYRCHRTQSVKNELKRMRTDVAMIPGGATGLLQAPDVSWIKPFKAAYSEHDEEWARTHGSTAENLTAAGNLQPPSKLQMCEWVVKAWNSLRAELIKKSFKVCGLTYNLDGSEDHDIHALKTLNMVPELQQHRDSAAEMNIENEVSSDDESFCDASSINSEFD